VSNLLTRIAVAAVGIPLILLLTKAGGFPFFAFLAVVSALGLHEFYNLARAKGARPQAVWGMMFGLGVSCLFIFSRIQVALFSFLLDHGIALPSPTMAQALLILLLVFVPGTMVVELLRPRDGAMINIAVTLFGVLYVPLFLGSLIGLRELFVPGDFPVYRHFPLAGPPVPGDVARTIDQWGWCTVMSVFAAVWLCDSGAYFAGRALGRHKLFERVSPNKTWEGAVAGFVLAVLTFVVARALILPYLTPGEALVCGSIVGVFGQVGDLAESLLKRDAGVKDSSALIPGHGGVLDRFDSLMFAAPLLYLYLDFVVF